MARTGAPSRQLRAPLTRERVLAAALQVADTEGLDAVTMRAVAAAVGVEAMSLYHHLPGKEGLLDGLVDAVAGEVQAEIDTLAPIEDDWRADVRQQSLAARRVMLRHPWAPGLIGTRQTPPLSLYGRFEQVMGAMVRGGMSYRLGHQALHSLGSMVLGFTQELFTVTVAGPAQAEVGDATMDELAAMAEVMPHISAMVAAELHHQSDPSIGWCDSQTEFEFTLDLLMDGLEQARLRD